MVKGIPVRRLLATIGPMVWLVGVWCWPAAGADAHSVALDKAFGRLQVQNDSADTERAESEIWNLWMHSTDPSHDALLASATDAMAKGRLKSAEDILSRLVDLNPQFAEAWNKRATLYYLTRRLDQSLADIDKTLALEPRHFGALSGRGMILFEKGMLREALDAYEDANAINPHMPGVRAMIARIKQAWPDL
jgi:tetratricopeptide (TPR) repeat protein